MMYEIDISARVETSYLIEADTPEDAQRKAADELGMDVGGIVRVEKFRWEAVDDE